MLRVRGDQHCMGRACMCGDRCVEVLDSFSATLEARLDLSERIADIVGPHCGAQLPSNYLEPTLQEGLSLRAGEAGDAVGNLGEHWLRHGYLASLVASQPVDDCFVASHQG